MMALRQMRMPVALCALVLLAYGTLYAVRAGRPGGALAFAVLGTSDTPGNRGYDGQYYYRIATAPLGGRHGLDRPAYRYQRIGYPLVARALALGDRTRIASTLVLINVVAVALGMLLVALLLARNGSSPFWAFPYALYIGQVACFWRDLAEPLAYALVAAALLAWRRERFWPGCVLLLPAVLTKENTLLFAAAAALHLLLRGRWPQVWSLLALVALPYALWQGGLWLAFGQTGLGGTDHPPRLPLGGLSGVRDMRQLLYALPAVAIPALLCLGLVGQGWWLAWRARDGGTARANGEIWDLDLRPRSGQKSNGTPSAADGASAREVPSAPAAVSRTSRSWVGARWAAGDLPTLALLLNVAFVLWLPSRSYGDLWASTRNAQGVVLAALAHPALGRSRLRWPLAALWACCAPLLWLA